MLRVLWGHQGKNLVRIDIHNKIPVLHQRTLGRTGQILRSLYEEGLIDRVTGRAQGSRQAGFYALSEHGLQFCRIMGFEHKKRALFPTSREFREHWLTPKHLSRHLDAHGQIVAVYGYIPGLGRSTLIAHIAKAMTRDSGTREQFLVADLDFESPGLDDFFTSQEAQHCRGLGGLRVDFELRLPHKRALWLRAALSDSKYVIRPTEPDVPGLLYLPSGLSSRQTALSPTDRGEALRLLQQEAESSPRNTPNQQASEGMTFLSELRKALSEKFTKVLIDSQFGRSLGSWIATQPLPDELVVCAEEADKTETTIAGLQAVLANFLNHRNYHGEPAGVYFLFRLKAPTSPVDLKEWIDRNLTVGDSGHRPRLKSPPYRVEQLPYDLRLAKDRRHWEHSHFYRRVIRLLGLTPDTEPFEAPPPELRILLDVLDPTRKQYERTLAAGLLENAPLAELARWIDWHHARGSLPVESDTLGRKLLQEILEVKMFSRIISASTNRTTSKE